jgi:tRNA(Ile)-lysidine synthase
MRNRHINDEYVFFGQTKSVKKNYINYKIPAEIRDILPVIYDGEGIIWACGLPVSDRVKVTNETNKLMILTVSKVR